ncbi:MAG: PIN domain-containing protein [Candidatus Thermoplasmatota archaeon]
MTHKILQLYLDTSVIGAIFDVEDPKRIMLTKKLLNEIKNGKYNGYISNVTVAEIGKSPEELKPRLIKTIKDTSLKIVNEDEECLTLADIYVKERVIPKIYRDDARQIAVAVKNNFDMIVSWNYRHMVNYRVRRLINAINLKVGYKTIEIVSPMEVVEHE